MSQPWKLLILLFVIIMATLLPSPNQASPVPSPQYQYPSSLAHAPDDAQNNEEDVLYFSPSEAPIAATGFENSWVSDTPAPPPLLPFNYSAEDDAGEFNSGEGYPDQDKKQNGALIAFVIVAICLVGLGGLVYRRRKNQKRQQAQAQYLNLSKREEV